MLDNGKVRNIFSIVVSIIMILGLLVFYGKYSFNFYYKGLSESGKTSFVRDGDVKLGKNRSYKIEDKDFTDAMFYREIPVFPYNSYKVTCMIKTQDVEQFEGNSVAGAQIVLKNTEEHSEVVSGTQDWKKIEFYFNSKNNDTVEIGFELGGNWCKAKGSAWFDEITIEQGARKENNKEWKFACFIFTNTNVNLDNGGKVNERVSSNEYSFISNIINKFDKSLPSLCKNKISPKCDIIKIEEPITTLSFDESNGYFVGEKDVYKQISKYIIDNDYSHIFVCFKFPDENKIGYSNVNDWIGLGNMEFCGIGFSNIRLYEDFYSINDSFPQEVFVHEFLHTLERNSEEYGYERPVLHNYQNYGYEDKKTDRLRKWYMDYMNKEIKASNGEYIGLSPEIFKYSPVNKNDFKYANKLDLLDEPKNIIQSLNCVFKQVVNLFNQKQEETVIQIVAS